MLWAVARVIFNYKLSGPAVGCSGFDEQRDRATMLRRKSCTTGGGRVDVEISAGCDGQDVQRHVLKIRKGYLLSSAARADRLWTEQHTRRNEGDWRTHGKECRVFGTEINSAVCTYSRRGLNRSVIGKCPLLGTVGIDGIDVIVIRADHDGAIGADGGSASIDLRGERPLLGAVGVNRKEVASSDVNGSIWAN